MPNDDRTASDILNDVIYNESDDVVAAATKHYHFATQYYDNATEYDAAGDHDYAIYHYKRAVNNFQRAADLYKSAAGSAATDSRGPSTV